MPKYDFQCSNCMMTVEYERPFTDESLPSCCAGANMIRVWSTTPVQFKGSGFYSTDNKK